MRSATFASYIFSAQAQIDRKNARNRPIFNIMSVIVFYKTTEIGIITRNENKKAP